MRRVEFDKKSFMEFMKKDEKSEATIQKYTREVEELFRFLGGRKLDKERLLEYRSHISSRFNAQTVNGKLSSINFYLYYAGCSQIRVKLLRIQKKAYIDEQRELTEKEYMRLLQAARSRGQMQLYYLMQTICSTGIRISELKYVTVEAVHRGCAEINLKRKYRVIIFPKNLVQRLKEYAEMNGIKSGPVFCTRNGKPLDRSNICHDMKKISSAAGVNAQKVYPHNLRHLFARSFYSVEKDIAHLADIMGHSSIETTRIYVAASIKDYERVLNQMQTGLDE